MIEPAVAEAWQPQPEGRWRNLEWSEPGLKLARAPERGKPIVAAAMKQVLRVAKG
jgi:hypothetical protein